MGRSQPTPTRFGELLRHWRVAAGLTQQELADRARMSLRGVSDLERGLHQARRETVQLLADALHLGPDARAAFESAARLIPSAAVPPDRRQVRDHLLTPDGGLIGRLAELARIEQHLAAANAGKAPVLLFVGEPGIGKSHLLRAAGERASAAGWRVLAGGCTRRSGQEPFAPFVGTLARSIAQLSPAEQRRALQGCAWLVRLLPELSETAVVPAPSWTLPPEQERRLMFAAVARYLASVAGPSGTLLVLDDLQWAGADALDLLAALAHAENERPLRIVGAYRTTEVASAEPLAVLLADLGREGLAAQMEVGPLAAPEAAALLDGLLEGSEGIDTALAGQVLQRAEGVPFFLLSCAQGLRAGALSQGAMGSAVPWNVAQTIRQRVAALPQASQQLLEAAAVIGRRVPRAILLSVMGGGYGWGKREWLDAVERACRAGLLVEVGAEAYEFSHDLIREAVGASLGAARRALLHQEIGEALEQLDERERRVAELAYHFSCTDRWEKALTYLVQAADRSRSASARHEEAALIGQAIEAATHFQDTLVIARLHCRRGRALAAAALWEEARREFEATLSGLQQENAELRIETLIDLAQTYYFLGDARGGRPRGIEALALAERLGRDDLAAAAINALGLADGNDGNLRESQDKFRAAFARAGSDRHPSVLTGLDQYGLTFYYFGEHEEALLYTQRALEVARDVHDSAIIVRTLGNAGMTLTAMGRYTEALRIFDEARRLGQEYRTYPWLGRAICMRAGLHLALCDFARAEALINEAREITKFANVTASTGVDFLLAFARRHDPGRAEGLLPTVREDVAKALGAHDWLMRLRFAQAQAEVALARGAPDEALRFAEDGIAQAKQRGRVKYEVLGMQAHARALAGLGRAKEAITELRRAVERARPVGDPALFLHTAAALLAIEGDDALLAETQAAVDQMAAALPDDLRRILLDAEPVRLITRLGQ
jgi:transcriptional regulator with XRE-family HTH domain/tetratricopeptide (TPR) repeat protein